MPRFSWVNFGDSGTLKCGNGKSISRFVNFPECWVCLFQLIDELVRTVQTTEIAEKNVSWFLIWKMFAWNVDKTLTLLIHQNQISCLKVSAEPGRCIPILQKVLRKQYFLDLFHLQKDAHFSSSWSSTWIFGQGGPVKSNSFSKQQISPSLKPAANLAHKNQNIGKMTRGDSSVNLLLVSRSKRSSFMYYPGKITATKTAGGGFPQIGGLVQGVPPRKIASIIGIIGIRPRFYPSSRWKDLVDFHPTARWSTGALLLETWIRQLGVDGFGSHTGFHCWWSQEKKNGLAELFVARKFIVIVMVLWLAEVS